MSVKIIGINNDPKGKDTAEKLNDEYIVIENQGKETVDISKWMLTDYRESQKHVHKFEFPLSVSNTFDIKLKTNELVFVMTGKGENKYIQKTEEHKAQYHLYWNNGWFIWNNDGDTACLYDSDRELVDTKTV